MGKLKQAGLFPEQKSSAEAFGELMPHIAHLFELARPALPAPVTPPPSSPMLPPSPPESVPHTHSEAQTVSIDLLERLVNMLNKDAFLGLEPVIEDFHMLMTFLSSIWDLLYDEKSVKLDGMIFNLAAHCKRRDVKKKCTTAWNSNDRFFHTGPQFAWEGTSSSKNGFLDSPPSPP